jgi:hypothetical protein
MGISTTNFGIVHENQRFTKSARCGVNEVINSVGSSFPHDTVNLSFSATTLIISGRYTNLYSPATWKYIPVDGTDVVTISNFEAMPLKIGTVVEGKKEAGSTKIITFTVNTTETIKTYTDETGYNSVTDPVSGIVTQVPYTYKKEHIERVTHSYNITQKISNVWDDFATQLTLAVSRGTY